jgi:hypothetical protein
MSRGRQIFFRGARNLRRADVDLGRVTRVLVLYCVTGRETESRGAQMFMRGVLYLIGDYDVGRRSTRQGGPTVSILVLQFLGCRSEAIHVGNSTASRVMTAYDGDVEGFRFATQWGRCRRRVENEKSEGEIY